MPISKIKTSSITADAASVNLNIDANTLFLDVANNRVGINTTSPGYGLHVSGTGVGSYVRISNTNGTYNAKFNVEDTGETTLGSHSNNPLLLLTNNIERLRIDANGNVGLGATPSTWASTFKSLQIGASSSIHSASDNSLRISYNTYYDGAYKRINAGYAGYYIIDSDGSFDWLQAGTSTAGSNISWTTAMTLDAGGKLGIGATPDAPLTVGGNAHISGITSGTGSRIYFDTTGSSSDNYIGTTSDYFLTLYAGRGGTSKVTLENYGIGFSVGGSERARFDSSGNLLISNNINSSSGQYGSPVSIMLRNYGGAAGVGGTILFGADSNGGAAAYGASIWYWNESSNTTGSAGRLSFGTKGSASETAVSERIRISTYGVVTKFDNDTNSYIRDHGVYSVSASYLHIKFNLTKNTERMLGWRIYGYKAYDTFIDTYYGCYLYSAYATPYGPIVRDAASPSSGAIYYGADGYLVISCATNSSNYTGLRLESMAHGGSYGGAVDIQVTAYKGHSASTGAY